MKYLILKDDVFMHNLSWKRTETLMCFFTHIVSIAVVVVPPEAVYCLDVVFLNLCVYLNFVSLFLGP